MQSIVDVSSCGVISHFRLEVSAEVVCSLLIRAVLWRVVILNSVM